MLKFIDLFAGLGGFHVALSRLGCKCVFASEINTELSNTYRQNFGLTPLGDITKIKVEDIPPHDILCGGFPCQPFSKAGKQLGGKDIIRGTLIFNIIDILQYHKPKYFILENVPNFLNSDLYSEIIREFESIGYITDSHIYSPSQFQIPCERKRLYIIGSLVGLDHLSWAKETKHRGNVKTILDLGNPESLEKDKSNCLNLWQEFLDCIPKHVSIPKFPIWAMEFGANYPVDGNSIPLKMSSFELGQYNGIFGKSLNGLSKEEQIELLPSYAINSDKSFPNWKKRYIQQNRDFYAQYEDRLKDVVYKISNLVNASWQKLEWNVGQGERIIRNYILQFRPSGIRVKTIDTFPTLVCNTTQIPIIGWENRYLTIQEAKKLQSLESLSYLPLNHSNCFKALGNAVNTEVVYQIAKELLK